MTAPLPQWVITELARLGIETPSYEDAMHRRLVTALLNVGFSAPLGQKLAAVRYVVRAEHTRAGREFAQARADHEEAVLARKVELLQGDEKISAGLAKDMAEHDAIEYRKVWLLAEQEERTLRLFLQAIEADLENHRTDRADWRAGDRAESHGLGGGL